ncbi:MAG: peptide-methionine (S)-S-oxide reductase MsrA [Halanaerobium sp.]|nr:peptide-methionine (S)-S-oxide reductase MsrA [Halanaerobium sp.]
MENTQQSKRLAVATLAGGCFWCMEAVFTELKGIKKVQPGYTGGSLPRPTYEEVCTGNTGHAEAIQITYDPRDISFQELLQVFFTVHDPTTLNRQGQDIGTQYRSAVFYHDEEQKEMAQQVIAQIDSSGLWNEPIVTEVTPLQEFFPAEDYHKDYFAKNPDKAYCQMTIAPKVAKLRAKFFAKLKTDE